MAVEDWIDQVASLYGEVEDGQGGRVQSYWVFKKAEIPEAISVYPCAITFIEGFRATYGAGDSTLLWHGVTEFHLWPKTGKSAYPYVMRFYNRILVASAAHVKLGGLVDHFLLRTDVDSIQGPSIFDYGTPGAHQGLVAHWEVKERPAVAIGI